MAKILYRTDDGQTVELEVSDNIASAFSELEKETKREEWRNEWRLRKKLVSMDKLSELGVQFKEDSPSPEEIYIEREQCTERRANLQKGLAALSAEQRRLVQQIYIDNLSLKEIAESSGVSYQAIQNRHKKILAKLRKYFDWAGLISPLLQVLHHCVKIIVLPE